PATPGDVACETLGHELRGVKPPGSEPDRHRAACCDRGVDCALETPGVVSSARGHVDDLAMARDGWAAIHGPQIGAGQDGWGRVRPAGSAGRDGGGSEREYELRVVVFHTAPSRGAG